MWKTFWNSKHNNNRQSRIATVDSCFVLVGTHQYCVAKYVTPAQEPTHINCKVIRSLYRVPHSESTCCPKQALPQRVFRCARRQSVKKHKKYFYNIAHALGLSKSYWAIMNKIFMCARPCSIKWRVQFHISCKMSAEFSTSSFCLSFGNVKIILNNPNPTSSLWLLPGKDVYFSVFVSIFIEYLYFVLPRFQII